MTRRGIAFGLIMAAAALPAVSAWAADAPAVPEQKRQLQQAYQGFYADGVCSVYVDLGAWQVSNWPEGRPVVLQFLRDQILPRFATDPAAFKDKTPDEIESEYLQFCTQTGFQVLQSLTSLSRLPAAEAARASQLRDAMLAAKFLGQCQTASALYLQGPEEHKNTLEKFVVAEVYAKDAGYRREAIDDEKGTQYWSDCDAAEARFKDIFEPLKAVP
jgi:hypothetical protein